MHSGVATLLNSERREADTNLLLSWNSVIIECLTAVVRHDGLGGFLSVMCSFFHFIF